MFAKPLASRRIAAAIIALGASLTLAPTACSSLGQSGEGSGPEVVIYTSVDQNFSEPILRAYEEASGVTVKAVYDVEAAKTTGLVNRLIEEKNRPQADVWWNGEFAQTIVLAEAGVLTPYRSPSAADIPDNYRDPEDLWTGFGGRARVLIVNTDILPEDRYPDSIFDLLDDEWAPNMVGVAEPMFGTTSTQAAALYKVWGQDEASDFFNAIYDRGVRVLQGNSVVRDQVAEGQLAWGLTDTDDACGAVERGDPVALVFPDQAEDELGTMIIPNSVAMVAGGPNPEEGQKLIDHLLSKPVVDEMVRSGWFQVPLRPGEAQSCVDTSAVKGMTVSLLEVSAEFEQSSADMNQIFLR